MFSISLLQLVTLATTTTYISLDMTIFDFLFLLKNENFFLQNHLFIIIFYFSKKKRNSPKN